MIVKKTNGKICGAIFNKTEQKALDMEIRRQCDEYNKKHENEIEAMILWNLHEAFGFGKKRLMRFHETFSNNMSKLTSTYDMSDSQSAWLCTHKLKDYGIDIEKLNKDRREN